MLQRIQTVYMLSSVIAILMMLLFPLATLQIPEATFKLTSLGISSVTPEVPMDVMRWSLLIVLLVMLVLPLYAIFKYKKQKIQLRILIYTAVLDVLFYALFFLYEMPYCKEMVMAAGTGNIVTVGYNYLMLIMPVLSLFCCIMAIRGVCYDIALLSSADRLRPSRK